MTAACESDIGVDQLADHAFSDVLDGRDAVRWHDPLASLLKQAPTIAHHGPAGTAAPRRASGERRMVAAVRFRTLLSQPLGQSRTVAASSRRDRVIGHLRRLWPR